MAIKPRVPRVYNTRKEPRGTVQGSNALNRPISFAPRLFLTGPGASDYIGLAQAQGAKLAIGGTRELRIGNATIRIRRIVDQLYIYITTDPAFILYEFFTSLPDPFPESIDGSVTGVEFNIRENKFKVLYNFNLIDLLVEGSSNTIDFKPTWTENNWLGRTYYHTVFQGPLRVVSSFSALSPEHMYGCFPLTAGMSNIDWQYFQNYTNFTPKLPPNAENENAVYRGTSAFGIISLLETEGKRQTGAYQTVTYDGDKTRRFFIITDDEGYFYVLPTEFSEADIQANLKKVRCTIPDNVVVEGVDSKLLKYEKVSFKINSTGTKAVTTFADFGYEFGPREWVRAETETEYNFGIFALDTLKPGAPFPREFHRAHASLPRLIEVEIVITAGGPGAGDFDVDIVTVRDYLPTDKYILGADYALDNPLLANKNVEHDDLLIFANYVFAFEEASINIDFAFPDDETDTKALIGSSVYAEFYNLTKDFQIKEYPMNTNISFRTVMVVATSPEFSDWSDEAEYLTLGVGDPRTFVFGSELGDFEFDNPFVQGTVYNVDISSCSIALRYNYFPSVFAWEDFATGDEFALRAYGVIYAFIDEEVHYENQSNFTETDVRHHLEIPRPKHFAVDITQQTGMRSLWQQMGQTFLFSNPYVNFSVHPDGHVSFSMIPLPQEDDFIVKWEMDVVAVWDDKDKEYTNYSHKDIFNTAFESERDYADYGRGKTIASFKTMGYWVK